MKLLHTADWHLGDRLGRIDRTDDLRRAVERVAAYCEQEQVDTLLIAGDLFSEMSRPDSLRESIEHLQKVFGPFLMGGGTIAALTGNHDNEIFCQTLRLIMSLAAPATERPGELQPCGRLYLATHPTFLRLADRQGQQIQFVLMPYPSPGRYLHGEELQRYATLEERNRHMQTVYARRLQEILRHERFDPALPTVLAAHIHVQGATLSNLFRMSPEESILFTEADLPGQMAYVALGHIHHGQCLGGRGHVRYSGSIERLDLGEAQDQKGVVVVEIGPEGMRGEPRVLPLEASRIYRVELPSSPLKPLLQRQRELYPDARDDLVHIEFTWTAGVDNLEETLRELETIFPRWYSRHWTEASSLRTPLGGEELATGKSFEDTVRDYLKQELQDHPDDVRDAILARAEALMMEEGS